MLRTILASRWMRGLLPLGLALALLSLAIDAALHVARADIIGWRIEARACQGPILCADFPSSTQLWRGRYACQIRAENLKAGVEDMPPEAFGLEPGTYAWVVRCVEVEGLPGA